MQLGHKTIGVLVIAIGGVVAGAAYSLAKRAEHVPVAITGASAVASGEIGRAHV